MTHPERRPPRAPHPETDANPHRPGNTQDQLQITAVTHLTEDGVDRRFIQTAVGHRCDTSTAIYTHVSGDFMNTALRKALTPAFAAPGPSWKDS